MKPALLRLFMLKSTKLWQPISSMCTYNTLPWIFASTSRDRSTRVYDLSLSQDSVGQEAHWPTLSTQVIATQTADQRDYGVLPAPNQPLLLPAGPTRFGPGLGGSVENEVIGIGRCVIILRGQSVGTGGHGASVLGAVCALFGGMAYTNLGSSGISSLVTPDSYMWREFFYSTSSLTLSHFLALRYRLTIV